MAYKGYDMAVNFMMENGFARHMKDLHSECTYNLKILVGQFDRRDQTIYRGGKNFTVHLNARTYRTTYRHPLNNLKFRGAGLSIDCVVAMAAVHELVHVAQIIDGRFADELMATHYEHKMCKEHYRYMFDKSVYSR